MSMQDPISNMLTIIRNALSVKKPAVSVFLSNQKKAIVEVLLREGYVNSFTVKKEKYDILEIDLKYYNCQSVITMLRRVSRPSRRIYEKHCSLTKVNNGFGISIVSTSQGVMSDRMARKLMLGGEIICHVS